MKLRKACEFSKILNGRAKGRGNEAGVEEGLGEAHSRAGSRVGVARERVVGGGKRNMANRKIDQKQTKQVVIDKGLHSLLKVRAAEDGKTIKEVLEELLSEYLEVKSNA